MEAIYFTTKESTWDFNNHFGCITIVSSVPHCSNDKTALFVKDSNPVIFSIDVSYNKRWPL